MRNDQVIHAMLQRFARAFTTGDGDSAAACWEVPALVVADEGSRAVASLDEVAAFFGGAREEYNREGVTGTRVDVQRLDWHTDRLATVTVRWPHLDGEGRELGRTESSMYLVRVTGDEARICAVVMVGVTGQP
jgi:hypothetical protein